MQIEHQGITINYRDEGEGAAVIFLHAFALNQTMWDEQIVSLKDNYRVISLDNRGFGKSSVVEGTAQMSDMAADVRQLLRALGIARATLVGLSMGGYIALAFCRAYPEAVRALVLADTRATADSEEARANRLRSAEKAEREGARAIADETTPKLLGKTTLEQNPALVERVHAIQASNPPAGIAAAQRGMAARRDSLDLLPQIQAPTLVIVGDEDTLTPPAEAEVIHQGIAHSQLRVIERAGHLSNMEQPEAFNAALREWLGSRE